jgi:hypothetical protein
MRKIRRYIEKAILAKSGLYAQSLHSGFGDSQISSRLCKVWYRSILSLQHSTFLSLTLTILDGKSQNQNPGLVIEA